MKGRSKTLFTEDRILRAKNPKESTRKKNTRSNKYILQVVEHKVNIQKSIVSLKTNKEKLEKILFTNSCKM